MLETFAGLRNFARAGGPSTRSLRGTQGTRKGSCCHGDTRRQLSASVKCARSAVCACGSEVTALKGKNSAASSASAARGAKIKAGTSKLRDDERSAIKSFHIFDISLN